jgi:ABC-type transport system involved in multi-copper enzyme maturation permease subunit
MSAFAALLSLESLRVRRARMLSWASFACAFVVLLAVAARYGSSTPGADVATTTASWGIVRLSAQLLPFAFAAGALSDELSARTLVYLTVRPLQRPLLIVGKWLVSAGMAAALLTLMTLFVHVACTLSTPSELASGFLGALRIALAASLEAALCTAACLALGALEPRAAGALGFVYLAGAELLGSLAPGRLRLLSMAHHALSLAGLTGGGLLPESVPQFSPLLHLSVLLSALCLWLGVALWVFSLREYVGSEHE